MVALRSLVRGLLRVVGGGVLQTAGRSTGRLAWQARGAKAAARGHGMLQGLRGEAVADTAASRRTSVSCAC